MARAPLELFPVLPRNRQVLSLLLPLMVGAFAVLAWLFHERTEAWAVGEARKAALDALLSHRAVHKYVVEVQRPEIYRLKDAGKLYPEYFSPKVMSFTYIARSIKERINQEREAAGLPRIYFKLATANPRNPINQADPGELAVLERMQRGEVKEVSEVTQQGGQPVLHLAVPIDRSTPGCLKCHGEPKDAPAELLAAYGPERGFHEKPDAIRALISIRVSLAPVLAEAHDMASLLALVAFALLAGLYALVHFFVLRLDRQERVILAGAQAKSRFLATMSHELRTPMNGILGMAQLLDAPTTSEAERRDYTRTILESGQTLLALLNDILDFSKIEAGRVQLAHEVFAPGALVKDSAALVAEMARQQGLALEARWDGPEDACYRGDPARLRQMLLNLLSNAIKFTERGRVEVLASRVEAPAGACLRFTVTDTGRGISPEQLPFLFQPFSQLDPAQARRFAGTGLGLSIVRSMAEAMGGAAGVESSPGRGSTFWFEVRVEPAAPGERPVRMEAGPAGTPRTFPGKRLLVAEDNAINRKVIEGLLAKCGVEVQCVEDGQQALDALEGEAPYDLVLMDCQMPVLDGIEATRRQRAREGQGRRTPIIALTAAAFAEDRSRCQLAGMDDFLTKPVHLDELRATLARWLSPP